MSYLTKSQVQNLAVRLFVPKVVEFCPVASLPQIYLFDGLALLVVTGLPVGDLTFLIEI